MYQVSRALGLTQNWPVVIVGAGNLGRALAHYGGFVTRGFRIEAVLDTDPFADRQQRRRRRRPARERA